VVVSDDGRRGQLGRPLGLVRVGEVLRLRQETRVIAKVLTLLLLLLLLLMVLTVDEESLRHNAGRSLR